MTRRRFQIEGIVQGVGFRPYVHRLAARLGLSGWARNTAAGLELELEGPAETLDTFETTLRTAPPPLAVVEAVHTEEIAPTGKAGFVIRPSAGGEAATLVSPDLAPCAACLEEMQDPKGRRYRYPFLNCTDCGPRFSIIRRLPYDRPATTMAGFVMCPDCAAAATTPSPIAARSAGPGRSIWTPKASSSPATPSPWLSKPWRRGASWR